MILFRRQSNIFKPPLGFGLNYGHPLAMNLVGAWLCNEGRGPSVISLLNANDALALQGVTAWVNQPFGYSPSSNSLNSNGNGIATTTPSASLKPANALSVFYRGFIVNVNANQNISNNPAVIAMSFTSTNTTPFIAWGIMRPSADATGLGYWDDVGGSPATPSATGLLPTANTVSDAGLTFKNGGNCVGYFNGRQVVSNARSGSLTYGSPRLYSNMDISSGLSGGNANTSPDVIYVWNRELSATEMLWLHTEPYALVNWQTPRNRRYFGALVVPTSIIAWQDQQIPQLLPQ